MGKTSRLSCAAALFAAICVTSAAPLRTVVRPADTGEALVNPGMGWTLHYYSNIPENYGSKLDPSDTLDDFPGLSTIYLRIPWSFLEPEENQFNWAVFDTPAQRWIASGKKIATRVTCSENWMRYATPKWVRDAGAKGVEYEWAKGPREGGPLWDPDFIDPVFLQKLEHFLSVMARRYDGNPNVAFIDVGTFGMWGEGHTGGSSRLTDEQTDIAVKRHIDLHVKHFRKTLLCISDDVAGPSRPGRRFPLTEYAREHGVTLRDDSILVQPSPRSWYHAELAQDFWPALPVILEHEHYGSSKRRGAWSGELLLKSVEDYHASYMSIHWWPREELEENRATIDAINRRLGYRLVPAEIAWPGEIALGNTFTIESEWANRGVAPCYSGAYWAITLKDDKGGIVSVNVNEEFDLKALQPGAAGKAPSMKSTLQTAVCRRYKDANGRLYGPKVRPGRYDLFLSVGQRDGTPSIALPLGNPDGQKRYKLGQIELKDPAP